MAARFLFTCLANFTQNLTLGLEKCVSLGYAPNKKYKGLKLEKTLEVQISLFWKTNLTSAEIIFSGGERKSRMIFWILLHLCSLLNIISAETRTVANLFKMLEIKESKSFIPWSINEDQAEEMLPKNQNPTELLVYTRRNTHKRNQDLTVALTLKQSHLSRDRSISSLGNSISSSAPMSSRGPIAITKSVSTCTQCPIAKYLSYHKLSTKHRAFTSKISHMFVPTKYKHQEHRMPQTRIVVMEEMNALKTNRTWKIVDLPKDKKIVGLSGVLL